MTYFVMALALALGFTQCKKEQPAPQTEGVRITLNVGDDNSKVVVTPAFTNSETGETYAKVEFEAYDVIYVGNNGAYCGYLEYNGSTNQFEGTVNPTSEADYLHFYFIGNKGTTSEPTSALSITDQTSKYPVISYEHSKELYKSGVTAYSAQLQNYCAIVKFNTTNIDADITISGMNNTVAVNFGANNFADGSIGIGNNPYSPGKTGDGNITLHKVSNTERWAILLPQGEVTNATASASGYTSETFTVPEIDNNQYLTNSGAGYSITMVEILPYIDANFTVASGRTVKFSKGNLQAVFASASTSTCTWRFADHQYDFVGNASANPAVGDNQVTTAGTVDLFGWVGANSSLAAYGINNNRNSPAYGNTIGEALKDDWGNLTIENAGGYSWRTLTKDEWNYVINTRTTTSNHRFVRANVCGKNGAILLPDNWNDGTYTLNNYNNTDNSTAPYSGNIINAYGWATLESAGCVFLPNSGLRENTSGGVYVDDDGNAGYYWSSTSSELEATEAYMFAITYWNTKVQSDYRDRGQSVRLVF